MGTSGFYGLWYLIIEQGKIKDFIAITHDTLKISHLILRVSFPHFTRRLT